MYGCPLFWCLILCLNKYMAISDVVNRIQLMSYPFRIRLRLVRLGWSQFAAQFDGRQPWFADERAHSGGKRRPQLPGWPWMHQRDAAVPVAVYAQHFAGPTPYAQQSSAFRIAIRKSLFRNLFCYHLTSNRFVPNLNISYRLW